MKFFKNYSTFNKIFFSVFLVIDIVLFLIPAIQAKSISVLFTLTSIMTFISSLSALLMAIYNSKASAEFFVWGLTNSVSYTYITYVQSLYGQVILTAMGLLPIQIAGLYLWYKNQKENNTKIIKIKKFNKKNWITYSIVFIISCIIYGIFILKLPEILNYFFNITIAADDEYIIDSINAMATLFAILLGAERYIEQWHFWIIANTTGILLFIISFINSNSFSVSSISDAVMWLQLEINAFYGLYQWRKYLKNQQV